MRTLEKENHELECKICDWLAQRTVVCHDHSGHLVTIEDLQDKVRWGVETQDGGTGWSQREDR